MKTINTKYIKKDKCRVPRDRLAECVFYLRYGQAPAHANPSYIWHSKPKVAKMLGVSEVVIGITIVAFGTSLPELAVSLASALKGEYGLAIGNIVGSNIFNLLAVIGIAATIEPAALAPSVLSLHIFVMVAFTLVLFAMTYDYDGKAQLSRLEGVALLVAYIAYESYVIAQNI